MEIEREGYIERNGGEIEGRESNLKYGHRERDL
jgi:hypothetical protein